MTNPTPPIYLSQLSQQMNANNFIALQSSKLSVTASTGHVTFTMSPGTQRVTFKITNTGTKGVYLCGSNSSNIVAAVPSQDGVPLPASGNNVVSNCDYIAAGAILQQDYIQGTDTISAICAGTDSSTLEISIGQGQ